jgi:hypothetical protein
MREGLISNYIKRPLQSGLFVFSRSILLAIGVVPDVSSDPTAIAGILVVVLICVIASVALSEWQEIN